MHTEKLWLCKDMDAKVKHLKDDTDALHIKRPLKETLKYIFKFFLHFAGSLEMK